MIPILYDKTETTFTSNGLGRLADCLRCIVTEERNGIYECEFDYPISGPKYDQIQEGQIIAVTHDDNGDIQPFDIYHRTAPIDGVVTFYARHISYRQIGITVEPFTASGIANATTRIRSHTRQIRQQPETIRSRYRVQRRLCWVEMRTHFWMCSVPVSTSSINSTCIFG